MINFARQNEEHKSYFWVVGGFLKEILSEYGLLYVCTEA